jgi:hypothetical protein
MVVVALRGPRIRAPPNVIATLIRRHLNGLRGPPVVGIPNPTNKGILRLEKGSPEFNEALADVYIRPDRIDLTAIDSLMISTRDGSPQAVFFQITLNIRHGLKTEV